MERYIPGTTLEYVDAAKNNAFSLIEPVLKATGGLTLSQLSTLTGLGGTTVQNWIKRGWVASATGKKYSEKQVLRILLINMLRDSMKLDEIAHLMAYVNGDVDDSSDDIIADIHLYNMLCRIIFTAEDNGAFAPDALRALIDSEMSQHTAEIANTDKLRKALFVMVLGYHSGRLKRIMDRDLVVILEEENAGSYGK